MALNKLVRLLNLSGTIQWAHAIEHLLAVTVPTLAVFSSIFPNSNFFFRHLHGDLNLDEIKNALRLLSVNGETNLMNLIML